MTLAPNTFITVCAFVFVLSAANAWFIFPDSGRQAAEGAISDDCVRQAQRGDCLFYVCYDQRHPCEYSNYALSYGWRFCDRMEKHYARLTERAQDWVNGTRVCSMTKMLEYYRAEHVNCRDVEVEMQRHRAECEAKHGACSQGMLMENTEVLTEVYTFNRKVLMRFGQMLRECGREQAGYFLSWFRGQGMNVMSIFRSLPDRLSGLQDDIASLRASLPDLQLPDIDTSAIQDILPNLETLPDQDN